MNKCKKCNGFGLYTVETRDENGKTISTSMETCEVCSPKPNDFGYYRLANRDPVIDAKC